MKYIHYAFPIAIYSCENKEVIGVFETATLAARYLFKDPRKAPNISTSLRCKSKTTTFLGKVTARACNEEQKKQLGNNDFIILNNYPAPIYGQMKGYTGNPDFRNPSYKGFKPKLYAQSNQ